MYDVPTASVMLNQDILYVVFEQLAAPDRSWYEYEGPAVLGRVRSSQEREEAIRRATLASCVRVCRAFFAPAASVLWRDLDDLDAVSAFGEGESVDVLQQPEHLRTSSLERRQRYFTHIRAIHRPQGPSGLAPPLIADSAGASTASRLALTKLRLIQEVPGNTDLLALLSPSLRSLHIIFRHPRLWHRDSQRSNAHSRFVEMLLVRAADSAPNLTYLRITRTSGIPESWLVPIQRYARLESVDLLEPMYDSVSSSALLQPLSTLQHLRTLKLRLQSASCTPALGAEAGFGSLRELHLYGKFAALQDATDLLRSVSSPHLRSLRVDSCECRTDAFAEALRDFCAVLRSKFASALEVVVLSVYGIGPEVTLERPLAEYLHLLLQVRGVKDVRLSLAPNGVIVAVSEADVSAMADSWPRLERLHLDCASFKSRGGGGLPRQVVDRMVLACPLLEDIRLPIDADSEVDTSTLPTRGGQYAYAASYPFSATKPVLRPCCAECERAACLLDLMSYRAS